jgi:hypothetical protein
MDMQTGSTMLDQFQPQYIGLAHPFTLPIAVGGPDIDGKERWRRPAAKDILAETRAQRRPDGTGSTERDAEAAYVKLYDITRGLPQRIEAQYRRHWSFVPGLWNLYFRDEVNRGANLRVRSALGTDANGGTEQDAAMAAAGLYKMLESGHYLTQTGEKKPIAGDTSKLWYAVGLTPLQRQLLRDFSFRTRSIPGTQEIRTMIGHLGFYSVFLGTGMGRRRRAQVKKTSGCYF